MRLSRTPRHTVAGLQANKAVIVGRWTCAESGSKSKSLSESCITGSLRSFGGFAGAQKCEGPANRVNKSKVSSCTATSATAGPRFIYVLHSRTQKGGCLDSSLFEAESVCLITPESRAVKMGYVEFSCITGCTNEL